MDVLSQDPALSWPPSSWMGERAPDLVDDLVLPQAELLEDAALSEDSTLIPEDDWTSLIKMDMMIDCDKPSCRGECTDHDNSFTCTEAPLLPEDTQSVDIDGWNRFCEFHHENLRCYRHNLDSLDAISRNNDNALGPTEDQQSLGALRQRLETLEDLMRPYVKVWGQAEVQHQEVKDYWYGKGVRKTPPTCADAIRVGVDGSALAEWSCTLFQSIQTGLQSAETLETPTLGDTAQVFPPSASLATSVCTITMSDLLVDP